MKPTKHHTVSTIVQKVNEIKSCIKGNGSAISNSKTIEVLLDSILDGIAKESATMPKLKLVK